MGSHPAHIPAGQRRPQSYRSPSRQLARAAFYGNRYRLPGHGLASRPRRTSALAETWHAPDPPVRAAPTSVKSIALEALPSYWQPFPIYQEVGSHPTQMPAGPRRPQSDWSPSRQRRRAPLYGNRFRLPGPGLASEPHARGATATSSLIDLLPGSGAGAILPQPFLITRTSARIRSAGPRRRQLDRSPSGHLGVALVFGNRFRFLVLRQHARGGPERLLHQQGRGVRVLGKPAAHGR
jgi:hypothetical protein